jgi:indolepyruvate ferredoxin oxidoreductase, beta subunit
MRDKVVNVVFAGIGGQGVLKASDILADAAFAEGLDVKKAEVHGMSQRGGSVSSDVRFGKGVLSPMVPKGEADFLVVLDETQFEPNEACLSENGRLITVELLDLSRLKSPKCVNIALLGVLSNFLDLDVNILKDSIKANLEEKLHEMNMSAFDYGQSIKM